jgi:hypothetical protein
VPDLVWWRDVLGTLRGTLVRIREATANPDVRTAIALVDALLLMSGTKKEDDNGQQVDRGGEKLPPNFAGKEV